MPSTEPDVGLDLTTVRSWPKPKSRVRHLTNWATHAPQDTSHLKQKKLSLFILRVYASRVGTKKWERERIPSRLWDVSTELNVGLELTNHEIMTWAEIKSQRLNQLSHPGTPPLTFLFWMMREWFQPGSSWHLSFTWKNSSCSFGRNLSPTKVPKA